ncbi:hypothetical protein OS42_37920 [Dickeya oryzae]
MARIDEVNECLKPIYSGEMMEPLFYETVGYDIYFEKNDPLLTITLPVGAEPRRISTFF